VPKSSKNAVVAVASAAASSSSTTSSSHIAKIKGHNNSATTEDDDDTEKKNSDDHNDNNDNEDSIDDDTPPEEEPLYQIGEKILARDQDGILYHAMIRRRLWGVHQHKQVQVGMVSSQEEINALLEQDQLPTWHYFVHYFQWNVKWDRWVSQGDVLEFTDANVDLSKTILVEHKALMKQFKQHSKHIDGGAFLKAWKERLQKLFMGMDDNNNNKNAKKRSKQQRQRKAAQTKKLALEKQAQLQKQSLWNRPPSQAQHLVLNFGLKKILVEDWELIVHFNNLHVLPAQTQSSVYHVLKSYLKETKGIEMKELEVEDDVVVPAAAKGDGSGSTNDENNNNNDVSSKIDDVDEKMATEQSSSKSNDDETKADTSSPPKNQTTTKNDTTTTVATDDEQKEQDKTTKTREDAQEWLDMATGICMLFDEALSFRLLYPSEQAQLLVLEKLHPNTPKSQLYGCEFLLRLFCQLPALLADAYSARQEEGGEEENIIKPILAKVYDFLRYLQTNQSTVFDLAYRKPNVDEVRQQTKLDKKKMKAAMAAKAVVVESA
jgi:hypothetical protein